MEEKFIREIPNCFVGHMVRKYVYVFRKWLDDPYDGQSTADKIVIVTSDDRKSVFELIQEFEFHDLKKEEFLLIDLPCPDTTMVLDTWMQDIDFSAVYPESNKVQAFTNWWLGWTACKPVEFEPGI